MSDQIEAAGALVTAGLAANALDRPAGDGGQSGAAADIALASDCGVELDATSETHAHILLFGEDQALVDRLT